MRTLVFLMAGVLLLAGCKTDTKTDTTADVPSVADESAVVEFGDGVKASQHTAALEMEELYRGLQANDTLETSFEAKVTEVCQVKGCWMKLDLGEDRTVMVKFKDYGFFMPKDLAGKNVVVEGKAFIDLVSVEDQKHYAEDAGESSEAIQAIDGPKRTYSFEASGVRVQ